MKWYVAEPKVNTVKMMLDMVITLSSTLYLDPSFVTALNTGTLSTKARDTAPRMPDRNKIFCAYLLMSGRPRGGHGAGGASARPSPCRALISL